MKKKCESNVSWLRNVKSLLLVMKLTFFLFFVFTLSSVADTYSQNTKLDLALSEVTIEHVLLEIENNSNFIFIYESGTIDKTLKRSISVKGKTIDVILSQLLEGTGVQYKIDDRQILLYKDDIDVKSEQEKEEQAKVVTISGKVTEVSGAPLPGVAIVVKGTTNGVVTDFDGNYTISGVPINSTLVFSFVGMRKQEFEIQKSTSVDVVMEPVATDMDEVVVVGYTTQRKATITGSISTITTTDLKQSPTANLTNALAGRMPGLMVNQFSGGEPGVDRSDIYVRGFGTYGDKSPIVIVDGVERSMNYLAPEEIETFTILKDASATAPYGVRGANGVIIITTKRGKEQEATVNFKASYGTNEPVKFPSYLGSGEYAELYNEAILNDNPGIASSNLNLFTQDAIEKFKRAKGDNSDGLGYNWDYFDYAFKPGTQNDYSLSIRGGNKRARYYVMANYFKQDGNYKHTDLSQYDTQAVFKRYNFRSNIDIDITDNFYAKLDIGARITDRNAPGTTAGRIVEFANTQPPYLPITVEANGDIETNRTYATNNSSGMLYGDQIYRFNILGELSRTGFLNEKNTYLNGSFVLGHKLDFITEGLKAEAIFSYDASDGRWINRKVDSYSEGYREYPGYATFVPVDGSDVYRTPGHYVGEYKTGNKYDIDQTIGNGFSRNSTVGRSYYQLKMEYARKFGLHNVSGMLLANRSKKDIDNQVAFCYQGVTGRATYAFDDRYLFEFNVGYNGSENFAPGNRYGVFPAVSAGWVISNENFMYATDNWLDNLKLRASYGLVGSDNIPNNSRFVYLQYFGGGGDYSFGIDNFGSGAGGGLAEGNLSNPNLAWEKAQKTDIGFDAVMFNQRLSITADYFYEHRYDIITDLSGGNKQGFPDLVGKDAPYINSGIVDNKGFDFEISWRGKIGNNFQYYLRPNFTYARNEIKFMNEIERDYSWRAETGKRIGEHFVYVVDHFVKDAAEAEKLNNMNDGAGFQTWGQLIPGDVVYKDLNGDGKIDDLGDRTSMGNPRTPEIMFGLPVGFKYKGFDFSMLFQGAARASVQLSGAAVWDFPLFSQDKYGKVKPMHLNRWTPETAETATYPALHFGDHSNNKNSNSSLFLYDASYLRLKTIELGYNIPREKLRAIGLKAARIYAQGLNLLTWDGLDDVDIDPETREGSGDWYPIQKVINFGIDVTF